MWHGAGSVAPAVLAPRDRCCRCCAKNGRISYHPAVDSSYLTQEREKFISDLVEAQIELAILRVKLQNAESLSRHQDLADLEWHTAVARLRARLP